MEAATTATCSRTNDTTAFASTSCTCANCAPRGSSSRRKGHVGRWATTQDLFYTTTDPAAAYRLYRHATAGRRRHAALRGEGRALQRRRRRSRSKAYLFSRSPADHGGDTLPGATAVGTKIVAPRQDNQEYDVDHRGDQFFIRTNQGGRNFALAVAPVSDPSPAQWKTILPHRADVMLQSVRVFAGHTVVVERANALPRLRVVKAGAEATDAWAALPFPRQHSVSPGAIPSSRRRRSATHTFVTTPASFRLRLRDRQSTRLKNQGLGGTTVASTDRPDHGAAADGTKVRSRWFLKTWSRRQQPDILTAYGSYGITSNVGVSSNRFSLIDAAVMRCPHPRGGDVGNPGTTRPHAAQKNTFTTSSPWRSTYRTKIRGARSLASKAAAPAAC